MAEGTILKALSGFYYVDSGGTSYTCRARGRFRHEHVVPLVGDRVGFTPLDGTTGVVDEIFPRRNEFSRPAVANIDVMVIVASAAIPVTDPFLIDRVLVLCELKKCEGVICVNKDDLVSGRTLCQLYLDAGFPAALVSADTGEGLDELSKILAGKVCAFTGNSGVGKSSILNALCPELSLPVDEVSTALGRGKHTTRHVEFFRLPNGALAADTPGFSSFELNACGCRGKEELQYGFREFAPYLDKCRFTGCSHVKEQGCAVLQAVREGKIQPSRHASYVRLYEEAKTIREWEK